MAGTLRLAVAPLTVTCVGVLNVDVVDTFAPDAFANSIVSVVAAPV